MKQNLLFQKAICLLILYLFCNGIFAQNVGINSTGATPNASALLDVDASPTNDRGLLIPRVALTQTSSNAPIGGGVATSLLIYNTATANDVTPGYYYWNGVKWVSFTGSNSADWALLGNSGTTAGTNFLGTTDAKDLVFKTNATEWMRLTSAGNFGIGISGPVMKLDVLATTFAAAIFRVTSNSTNVTNSLGEPLLLHNYSATAGNYSGITFLDAPGNFQGSMGMKYGAHTANGQGDFYIEPLMIANPTSFVVKNTTGYIGMGTSTPSFPLHVYGSTNGGVYEFVENANAGAIACSGLSAKSNAGNIAMQIGSTAYGAWSELGTTASGGLYYDVINAAGDHVWRTTASYTERMRITNAGNVGIGTSTPVALFEVVETSLSSPRGIVSSEYAASSLGARLTMRKARGTNAAPTTALSGDNIGLVVFNSYDGASFIDGATVESKTTQNWGVGANGCNVLISTTSNNTTGRQVRVTIDDAGNFGINATPSFKLDVAGTGRFTSDLRADTKIAFNSDPTNYYIGAGIGNGFIVQTWDEVRYLFNGGGSSISMKGGALGIGTNTPTQALHVVGNICYTGSIAACSDARYKKDFSSLTNSLANVLKINGLNYYWRKDEFPEQKFTLDKQIGFIAQDLEKIYPELVTTDKNGYKSVDYARLTPILVEAMKEQQKIIESQQTSIQKLNAAVENVQSENKDLKTKYDKRLESLEMIINARAQK